LIFLLSKAFFCTLEKGAKYPSILFPLISLLKSSWTTSITLTFKYKKEKVMFFVPKKLFYFGRRRSDPLTFCFEQRDTPEMIYNIQFGWNEQIYCLKTNFYYHEKYLTWKSKVDLSWIVFMNFKTFRIIYISYSNKLCNKIKLRTNFSRLNSKLIKIKTLYQLIFTLTWKWQF